MVGLSSGTGLKLAVLGGIITIAIADSFSDALGIHVVEEAKKTNSLKQVWEATIATLLSKLVFSATFIIPVLFFDLGTAIVIGAIWGFFLLTLISISIAKEQKIAAWKMVAEHITIAAVVIAISHYAGVFIKSTFVA